MSLSPKTGIALTTAFLVGIVGLMFWALTYVGVMPRAEARLGDTVDSVSEVSGETAQTLSAVPRPIPVAPLDSAAPEDLAIRAIPPVAAPSLTGPGTAPAVGARSAIQGASQPGSSPSLLIPVSGVRRDQLVDTYTQSRSNGRSHDAIDIIAPRGTPVIAAADGTVLKLFRSVQGGTTLYQLDPDRRTIYYYAHLDRYAANITEGMELRRGQTLGYVGDTGNSGAGNYHLHFEITTTPDPKQYWGGVASNPYPRLR